jgi:hypothetical protein
VEENATTTILRDSPENLRNLEELQPRRRNNNNIDEHDLLIDGLSLSPLCMTPTVLPTPEDIYKEIVLECQNLEKFVDSHVSFIICPSICYFPFSRFQFKLRGVPKTP